MESKRMLQVITKKGKIFVEEVPAPTVSRGSVLIKVVNSCISAGTELGKVTRTGKSLIKTAMEQPENVKQLMNMMKERGVSKTVARLKNVLASGKLVGYSVSGIVIGTGTDIKNIKPGDRVAAAGADLANHAEYVNVPENLVMKMPKDLDFKAASTVTLGGIALQGIRRADLKLGEFAAVVGVGLIGLLTVQMLKISGIRVAAVDINEKRLKLARELGAELTINANSENMVQRIENWSNGYGADAVIFTAATQSSNTLSLSFKACKKKGRLILVGVSGMEINRQDLYPKELDFLISTSYGPGRYDRKYEEKGLDYPYAYVRWTENRNMSEYLRLLCNHDIKLEKMIDKVYPVEQAEMAFASLKSADAPVMVLLEYGSGNKEEMKKYLEHERKIITAKKKIDTDKINIALIGAGNFAIGTHIPNIKRLDNKYTLYAVIDKDGYKAKTTAKQYGAQIATTDIDEILQDDNIDLIFITTRHESHASLTLQALQKGRNVFVEKPLATRIEELELIEKFYSKEKHNNPVLMVGYNRRFSKYAREIKKYTQNRINPLFMHYRMNAGYIPSDHWIHENGGRIVGEACHIIDLMTFLTESEIKSVSYQSLDPRTAKFSKADNKSILLHYQDGSIATIEYFAVGSKEFPKEYLEIHFDEKTIVMEDYKKLKGYGVHIKEINSKIAEKGHLEELIRLYDTLKGSNPSWPIQLWEMIQTTKITLDIQ
jgi:predicted dehydrogenase/threonine dehydrogenase-like Zn-dependent dehydrogenase